MARSGKSASTGDAMPDRSQFIEGAPERRRYEIRKIDLWSVIRTSLLFNLAGLGVILVAGVVIWLLATALGAISGLEDFLGSLLSAKDFKFASLQILQGFILLGLIMVAISTILVTVATSIYNLFAERLGGVALILVEEYDE